MSYEASCAYGSPACAAEPRRRLLAHPIENDERGIPIAQPPLTVAGRLGRLLTPLTSEPTKTSAWSRPGRGRNTARTRWTCRRTLPDPDDGNNVLDTGTVFIDLTKDDAGSNVLQDFADAGKTEISAA